MRAQFQIASHLIYLNSGTHSLCPSSVLEAVGRHQKIYEENPTLGLLNSWSELWKVQCALADFFRANPNDLFLRSNVTLALNEFIQGIPLPQGGEIAYTDLEYGAIINACRLRAERENLKLRSIHLPLKLGSPTEVIDLLTRELRPETSMLLVSHVMTGTGLTIPLSELARETRRRGILLVIDGAHGPGALPVHFDELEDVDFYGGNLHKWMMGPKGTAFGWTNPRHHHTLEPRGGGWPSFEKPEYFEEFGGGHRFTEKMALLGCHDFAPFFAIQDMLDFWKVNGEEAIRSRLTQLQQKLEFEMQAHAPWRLLSPKQGPLRGPLLTWDLPDRLQAEGSKLLKKICVEHGLQIAITHFHNRFAVRISPHIYNTEDEIVRAAKILAPYALS